MTDDQFKELTRISDPLNYDASGNEFTETPSSDDLVMLNRLADLGCSNGPVEVAAFESMMKTLDGRRMVLFITRELLETRERLAAIRESVWCYERRFPNILGG
jgi:hypothetical protein